MPDQDSAIATADAVRRVVTRLARQLRRLRANHDVSAAKLSVLGQLYRAGTPLTAVDLARAEGLQPQSLTRIIAELDERGLVARTPDPTDRRAILIDITAAGRALLTEDARAQTAWILQAMAENLTQTEQSVVQLAVSLLARIAGSAELQPSKVGWGGAAPPKP